MAAVRAVGGASPFRTPHRVVVLGSSGSGKSTLARRLAASIGGRAIELDGIYHQAGWTHPTDEEFRLRVSGLVRLDRWVIDGNYSVVRPLVLAAADTVVWLDYPRWVVMQRVLRRSAIRAVWRRELWNGNRESIRKWIDAEHPIRWSWANFERKRCELEALLMELSGPRWGHLEVHRFRHPSECERWLRSAAGLGSP